VAARCVHLCYRDQTCVTFHRHWLLGFVDGTITAAGFKLIFSTGLELQSFGVEESGLGPMRGDGYAKYGQKWRRGKSM